MRKKQNWQAYVRGMLSQGFGVEDIAVELGVKADSVREMVKIMRRTGALDAIYGRRAVRASDA